MVCPHCRVAIHANLEEFALFPGLGDKVEEVAWSVFAQICPECEEPIIDLVKGAPYYRNGHEFAGVDTEEENFTETRIWPVNARRSCPEEVPDDLRRDFLEASVVCGISPQASAALSRRCLQHLLREYAKVKETDLSKEIREVIGRHILPSDLEQQLDAVRNIGNFAAHAQKDRATGEILPVEPHEAEWNLDVLEELFDFYFVRPGRIRLKAEKLNQKLSAAGKPLLP